MGMRRRAVKSRVARPIEVSKYHYRSTVASNFVLEDDAKCDEMTCEISLFLLAPQMQGI